MTRIWHRTSSTHVRSLRRTPQFTAAAVMTLALGIGANTAMFSFADATALRPPDVPRPGEIVRVFTSSKDTPFGEVSYPDYLDFRARTKTLAGLVAYETGDFALAIKSGRNRRDTSAAGLSVPTSSRCSASSRTIGRGFLPPGR